MAEQDERLQPVTFGSTIYLSTESSLDSFAFCDGFMEKRVKLKSFPPITGHQDSQKLKSFPPITGHKDSQSHHDFSFCLFMVLPFVNESAFEKQRKVITQWRQELINKSQDAKLSERKATVINLKNALESELQFNQVTLEKSKGSNICFGSSIVMLLHINSLKLLCLQSDDNLNLFLELAENPTKCCFFNFDASLKLQRGRSDNFVYEDEIVYITCSEKFSGKNCYVCLQQVKEIDSSGERVIVGSIDEKENWKVNIFEEPPEEADQLYMKIGACVWILLSEKPLFLGASRTVDPFRELYDLQYMDSGREILKNYLSKWGEKKPSDSFLEKQFREKKEVPNLSTEFLDKPYEHIYDVQRFQLELTEIHEPSDKAGETEELSQFGLWKIEALNVKRGGVIMWGDSYRLKHLITGMYLTVYSKEKSSNTNQSNNSGILTDWRMSLSNAKDETTEFVFRPIENLLLRNQPHMRGKVQKDAFLMIHNTESGMWVGFQEKSEENANKARAPVLFDVKIDVNTFRFREASFETIWENYFLVSSVPVLLDLVKHCIDTEKMIQETKFKKDTLEKKAYFDTQYPKAVEALQLFIDFLLNRIMININLQQDIMYPSDVRQVKFRQLYILGLVVWLIIQVFPSFQEFELLGLNPLTASLDVLSSAQGHKESMLKLRKNFKAPNAEKYNLKVCQEHLLRRYRIVQLGYKVLQAACYQNPENQEFTYQFLIKLSDHFGHGEFVSDCIQIMFRGNSRLLHEVHRLRFTNQESVKEHIFQVITSRLKLFQPYHKIEVLELLGAFTQIGNQSIYINQEKVFSSIVENKNFLFGHLLKMLSTFIGQEEYVMVEYRVFKDKQYASCGLELEELVKYLQQNDHTIGDLQKNDNTIENLQKNNLTMLAYFREQLHLYALLCQNRNQACIKNMRELMPFKVLLKYLQSEKLTDDFRAIICYMMANLYVDKEPRTIINKPNFVRVFRPPPVEQSLFENFIHIKIKTTKSNQVGAVEPNQMTPSSQQKDDDLTARFIEINLSDDIHGAYEIREFFLQFLEARTESALRVQSGKESSDISTLVFNELTYAVIKSLMMMIKFGLFTKYASQLMANAMKEKTIKQPTPNDESQDHLEKVVRMLAFLLEFEFTYIKELKQADFKRTYENKINFGFDLNIGDAAEDKETEEGQGIKKNQDETNESQNHQFLKRYQALLKIILKFTNKTYTNKEFEISCKVDYTVLIKREICDIFENLLEWREDYYIENMQLYFQQKFYSNYDREQDIVKQQADIPELKQLMPDLFVVPGDDVRNKQSQFMRLCQREEVRDLDSILERPFVEILLITFYFSSDPQLQNSLADLLFKLYNQRDKLIKNIQKVSLVEESSVKDYSKLSSLVNKLKSLLGSSQNWLQIIEQNNYDEKAEETLMLTQKKLIKMIKVFTDKELEQPEIFMIKQKVFQQLGGHKMLMKFIEQGATVIDARVDYFKEDPEGGQFSYKNQFIQNVRNTFVLSHRILSTFVRGNPSNQLSVSKKYKNILMSAVNINIGQVEFIQDLFRGNLDLCFQVPSFYFQFSINLIKDHGHYAQFLQLFVVFLNVASLRQDNVSIQKAILHWLFQEDNITHVHPLKKDFENPKAPPKFYIVDGNPSDSTIKQRHLYLITFIQITCNCLKVDPGINYTVLVNHNMDVNALLKILLDESRNERKYLKNYGAEHDASEIKCNLCEILCVFFSKLDTAIGQFKVGSQTFIELLVFLTQRLQLKRISQVEQLFIGAHVLGLVNTYFEHFLKDIGMIALKILSSDARVEQEKKVFEFAQKLVDNVHQFQSIMDKNDNDMHLFMEQISRLVKSFNLVLGLQSQIPIIQQYMHKQDILHIDINDNHQGVESIINDQHHEDFEEIKAAHQGLGKQANDKVKKVVRAIKIAKDCIEDIKQTIQMKKSKYVVCWDAFVDVVSNSKHLKESVKEEKMKFPDVILQISKMFTGPDDVRLREVLVGKDDIIIKLLQYIQYWKARGANRNTIIFILKSIRQMMVANGDESSTAQARRQNYLDSLSATSIALKLYWKDKQTEDQYIYQLIKLIIGLLDGGNKNIQMSIYQLFKSNPDSEAFFRKIFNVLTNEINKVKKSQSQVQTLASLKYQSEQRKFIEKTLRVIQLLCEGHNTLLQDYLRQQTNSKISYDLVNLMVKLVITYRISNATYESVVQSLETLTEVVQGPCKENQMVIVTSKFLEWSIDLLREEEKLFDQAGDREFGHGFQEKRMHKDIHRGYLMRLKYKCTVTLNSLLEMQENNHEIINRIVRSIPCSVIASELAKVYFVFTRTFDDDYCSEAFKRSEKIEISLEEPENPDDELVIEYGFNLFILTNILMMRNPKQQEAELEEVQNIIQNYQFMEDRDDEVDLFGDLSNVLASGLGALKNLAGRESGGQSEVQLALEKIKLQNDAFKFFALNTGFIEVIRDQQLQRLYFPILPECKMLPKENKLNFHEYVDHTSTREKLIQLISEGEIMIHVMKHEERLHRLFKTSKVLEIIASHKALWENLAFLCNIIVNFTIMVSYSQYVYSDNVPKYFTPDLNIIKNQSLNGTNTWAQDQQQQYDASLSNVTQLIHARLYEPRLFFNDQNQFTSSLIQVQGLVTLIFTSLVVIFFILKKAPLLIKDIWVEFFEAQVSPSKKALLFIQTILQSLVQCCSDFDFLYYGCYMTCVILGLVVHPFIFVFLLSDFLRIATLKIVVKAIWISKGPMGLSFLVFLLLEYYFTIIDYLYFWDMYQPNQCMSVWECFLVTFDWTFKAGGAIGGYLQDQDLTVDENSLPINYNLTADQQNRYLMRFALEVLFKFLLVVLIISMVSGIIIDTFGALKDEMLEKVKNLTEFCFICGIEREKLDKSAKYGYFSHIKKDHYMWNYVYYKAYIEFKSKLEFSGNETYIKRQLDNGDIDWFPVKKAIGVADEEEEDDDSGKIALIEEVNLEIPQLESLAAKVLSQAKNIPEKN